MNPSTNTSPGSDTWFDALASEQAVLERFVMVLETEQQHLVQGQTEALIDLSQQKTQLADQLSHLAQRRRSLQPAPGVPAASHHPKAQSLWSQLIQLAEKADRLNRTNGELIQVKLRLNQQALSILTGAVAQGAIYGPNGHPAGASGSRKLGSV